MSAHAAREILAGIYDGLGHREPSPALARKIEELEDQIEQGRDECGCHARGWDCMHFEF